MVKETRSYLALCSRVGGAHLARRHAPMHNSLCADGF